MNPGALFLMLCLVGGQAEAQTTGEKSLEVRFPGKSRVTPQRPTALPENKELADQFAWCAGAYATHIRALQAAKKDVPPKVEALMNWLWFNAIDLSDETYAKAGMAKSLKQFGAMSKELGRISASGDKKAIENQVNALIAELNKALKQGEDLYAKYEKVLNIVTTDANGDFTVKSHG